MKRTSYAVCLHVVLCLTGFLSAQVPTGTPPFGSFGGGPFDVVNLGNLNAHFAIPIRHKAGRGTPFAYDIGYDSSVWYPVTSGSTTAWQPVTTYGWNVPGVPRGYLTNQIVSVSTQPCSPPGDMSIVTLTVYAYYVYHDQSGGTHPFGAGFGSYSRYGCATTPPGPPAPYTSTATDGSGFVLTLPAGSVSGPNGQLYVDPANPNTTTDSNGNQISVDGSGNLTDTLGVVALTVTGTNPTLLKYTAPNNSLATYTINYTSTNIKTNFDCSGVSQYNATGVLLPTSIVLPDATSYTFTYEDTAGFTGYKTGRLASVTLPTGGSISYSYPLNAAGTKNTINCADGSAPLPVATTPSLTRTVSPGGVWKYSRNQVSGAHWTTTVTTPPDPTVGNDTMIDFQQDTATGYGTTHNFFETQRLEYQGSSGSGTLLRTTITCYNTASPTPTNCPTTAVSTLISRRTVFSYLPDTGSSLRRVSETDVQYSFVSDPSFPTEIDNYDYGSAGGGPGSLINKVLNGYASYGTKILPIWTQVQDSSNVVKSSTSFLYDQTTPTTTTGTPQHGSAGSRGNLTQMSRQVSSTVNLYRKFTYYDTGTLNTATDWGTTSSGGSNTTTYTYNNTGTPSPSCGNSFATSVTEPLSLSHSMTWDCDGGVMTSATDENGQPSTVYYKGSNFGKSADANFWRPYAVTDQLSNPTTLSYLSATVSESALLFNSNNSVVDNRIKLDSFGRPIVNQTKEGPSSTSYDSTETDYDTLGRVSKGTLPYTGSADATCTGTCPGTTTTYDALYRPLSFTDGGGGSVAYTYTKNDSLQVVSGQPTGENTKQRQYEYNSLGWLTSVCELTSTSNGGGTCNQTNTLTGYWIQYTYDLNGNMTGVTQNAQAATGNQQTRTYVYDMIGRLTSEKNPETGSTAITYVYDTLSSDASCGTVTSVGDLLKKTDAMGNVTCYTYDALHRVTAQKYPTGTYASATDEKHFVYDTATVNSISMANAKTRLAEAYTCTGACSTHKTDLGFSYSARGEVADVWESTLDSAGWFHVNATYWASGALDILNGGTSPLPGLPAITYGYGDGSGIDGKGRITKVAAASGQNPVTATTYNLRDQITAVTFGSADNDAYQFDNNTGRMTQYQFNMGTGPQSHTGALTWNANGTLQKLQITDQINTANSQTCKFGDPSASIPGYDDLGRLISANCGAVWSQSFSFDPFGNLKKSGSASFLPTYTGDTGTGVSPLNQYYQVSTGPSGVSNYYDANGNLKNDVTHTYTWDADGHMLGVDGTTVTMMYDALGRMIEQTRGSSHTEIVYGPTGMKLALMNGISLVNAFVKLPSGARAVYNNSGLAYYRHADHLGSSRLATTPSRTKYYDVAYAPYGEDYDGSGTTADLSFTDQNQDTVGGGWSANLYDFMFREYRTAHGRWASPDPSGLGAVDPSKPQSWNRYGYVLNNPLALVDPLGLYTNPNATCGGSGQPPCIDPPPGCKYVSDAEGDYAGMQCQTSPGCQPNGVYCGSNTGQSCPPTVSCGGQQTGGGGGGVSVPIVTRLQQIAKQLYNCGGVYRLAAAWVSTIKVDSSLSSHDYAVTRQDDELHSHAFVNPNTFGNAVSNIQFGVVVHEWAHTLQMDNNNMFRIVNALDRILPTSLGGGSIERNADAVAQQALKDCGISP